ncbi:hypothetical protein ACAK01_005447 [Pseudomonas aeruginosa]
MNKALAEQAGGDERAAFERAFTVQEGIYFDDKRGEYRSMNLCAIEASDAQDLNLQLQGWQARAALAQPSPMYDPKRCLACGGDHGNSGLPCPNMRVTAQAQPSPKCVKCGGTGEADSGGVHPWGEPVLIPCDCETEQAVAERPEVVAYADPVAFATFKERGHEGGVAGREWMWAEPGAALVAMSRTDECERIVGALREQYECNTAIMHARTEALSRVTSERDAALSRVAELEKQERPEGPTEDELEAAGLGYPLHKEEAVKLWYSGFRSEVITVLEAWEAIGHDIGMNPDKGELLDSLRYMLEKCEAHDAALARVAELERQQPVAWMHDQPNRVDVIHRDVKDLLQRVPGSSRGIYRPLDVSEHYTIPLYAAPVAQAQHSVPEGWKLVPVEPTEDVLEAIHNGGYVGDDQELRWFYQSILAAAPAPGGE